MSLIEGQTEKESGANLLTRRKGIVMRMAFLFFNAFMCFSGSSSLLGFVYDKIGLYNLGQVNEFLAYIGFFISTFFARRIIRYFKEVKTAIFTGFLIYGFTILASIATYGCYLADTREGFCSILFLRLLNYFTNLTMGLGAPFIWSGQYELIDRLSTEEDSKEHFAIFFSWLKFNGVTGNLLNLVFYSFQINSLIAFTVFYLGFNISTGSFLCLIPSLNGFDMRKYRTIKPKDTDEGDNKQSVMSESGGTIIGEHSEVSVVDRAAGLAKPQNLSEQQPEPEVEPEEQTTVMQEVKAVFQTTTLPKVRQLIPFMIQAGLYQGFLAGMMYRLVVKVYEGTDKSDIFQKKVISLVMIVHSLGAMAASQILSRLSRSVRQLTIRLSSCMYSILCVLLMLIYEDLDDVTYVFEMVLIYGALEVCFNQLTSVYLSEHLPGNLEAFSVFKQCQNAFTFLFMAAYITLSPDIFRKLNATINVGMSVSLLLMFRGKHA